ncbi:MAG: glycoside hydrolase family 3 C-terminal domain-containing protein [Bacteroidales bacterium]|nr:glycoside hydrolase family 3 C-terminal domain-containing protein [Bacteroidales bacterium]
MVFGISCQQQGETSVSNQKETDIEVKVAALLHQMTIEEKVGQMTQVTLDVLTQGKDAYSSYEPIVLDTAKLREAFEVYQIGSVLNTANNRARSTAFWNSLVKQVQDYAISHSRLNIPVIYGLDMIHGASYVEKSTLFPQEIGMAATWNPELIKHAGEITAYETRATGVAWTFSPVLDLGVDPRWPRMWETFGEDPYLASIMGHNLIKGLQGDDNSLSDPNRIASCLKHFLGYSQTVSGKDRSPAWIPEIMLREYHVPPFKAGVDAGAMTVMVNSGEINGIPTHVNKALLTDLLKEEWKFKGFIVTDWSDIEYLYTRHKVAESHKEAVKMAINAGIDMSMVPYNFEFAKYLVELVNAGEVPMERIDDAVTRILRVKFLLGLFDKPYTKLEDYPDFGSEKFAESARKTALESVTLLKNQDNMLPLAKNLRILVGGPAANSMRALNGGWSYSWQGELADEFTEQYQTIYEAIRDNASNPDQVQLFEGITYAATNDYRDEIVGDLNLFARKAAQSDVVVLCIGENSYTEKPGDLEDLYLSENQQELVKLAAKTGKPVVLVLVEGRPRVISKIEPVASAILHAYLTSNYGGEAVAKILFGIENPSGKLPYAYPRFPNSLEPYYHKHAEELEIAGSPTGTQYNPQYPFGYGLSYAQFEYSGLKTDKTNYLPGETIKVEVSIRNTSAIAGKEVIQLYISDKVASVTPSVKRLRAFNKTMLLPGENKLITFEVPVNALAFVGTDNQWLVEKGAFQLHLGTLQTNIQVDQTNVVSPPAL